MSQRILLLLPILLIVSGFHVAAQQGKHAPVKIFRPMVYLGHSAYSRGTIQKSELDKLLKQGLSSHDSTGKKYKVVSFDFTYAERNLYEDSVGNLMITPDYLTQHCDGDTLATCISNNIYDRTKAGDTVFIDNILVVKFKPKSTETMPDSDAFLAKGMKLVITK